MGASPAGADAGRRTSVPDARAAVLAELRSGAEVLHPGLLAARVGLHVSTARRHLQVLETLGLVERVAEERDDPGRPRVLYRATTSPGEAVPVCVGYRFVAESLARWVEDSTADPETTAREIGGSWGRHLVNAPPLTHTQRDEAIAGVLALLDQLGYAPSRVLDAGRVIELGRCPFQQLSAAHPKIGCGLHVGIVSGALESLGAEVRVAGRQAFPGEPDRPCLLELEPVSAPGQGR